MTPLDRVMMFHRGFGDGAKGSAIKHQDNTDYMEAREAGRAAMNAYMDRIRAREGFTPPNILRLQDVP